MNRNTKVILGSLLGLLLSFPFSASAQEAVLTTGTINVDVTHSWGGNTSASGLHFWEIELPEALYRVNAIGVNFCGISNTGGGINLIVRGSTTTGAILASTSIESADIPPCGRQVGAYYQASTTNAVLFQEFSWGHLAGEKLYIELQYRNTGGTIYAQYKSTTATDGNYYFHATPGTRYESPAGTFHKPIFTLYSNAAWASGDNRTVGSSTRVIECEAWYDLDCQIANAFTFLFIPSADTLDEWQNLSLASTTPFGYVYDIPTTFSRIYSTSSATWQLAIDFSTLGQQADAFRNIATSSVTVFDACWLNREVGEAGANLYQTYVIPAIKALMWLGVLFGLWTLAHRIF